MKILLIKDVHGEIKAQRLELSFNKNGQQCDIMSISDNNNFSNNEFCNDNQKITIYSVKAIVALKNGWLKNIDAILDSYDIIQVCEYNQIYTWYLAKKYQHKMVCYHVP